jgi:hypothetical protein
MYSLSHKIEAERRLLADRTAAVAAKLKEKLEKEKKEEAERMGRERWSKRRAEVMRERERQKEAAEASSSAKVVAVSVIRERERNLQLERLQKQQMMDDAPVSPQRLKVCLSRFRCLIPSPHLPSGLQDIENILNRVYEIYCPQKMNKIDKLLSKYVVRPSFSFLSLILLPACPLPFPPPRGAKKSSSRLCSTSTMPPTR